jgi:flagellar hook protein FlgE
MAISSSLYSGISGLNTNGNAMAVIGNNIANTNTIGFKSSRAVFSDLLSASINGSGGASQVGRGTGLSTVDNVFGQGTFESTESNTDLAIEGTGLFVLREPTSTTSYYTRAGAFRFDGDGYLVNPEGFRVQGIEFDADGNPTAGNASDIQVNGNSAIPANMTANMTLSTNLDANSAAVSVTERVNGVSSYTPSGTVVGPQTVTATLTVDNDGGTPYTNLAGDIGGYPVSTLTPLDSTTYTVTFDVPAGDTVDTASLTPNASISADTFSVDVPDTYNYASSTTVYDSLGNTHMLTTYFSKVADNSWDYNIVDENNNTVASAGANPLTYDTRGVQTGGGSIIISGLNWGSGTTVQDVELTLDTTQYANESQVLSQDQDGYGAGNLMKVSIDESGTVTANYSNGEQIKVSQIVLAKFANFGGLVKQGQNLFTASEAAGPPRTGVPGLELGSLFTNALEQSTVDLAAEFVKMITTQRGFQANSRVITTTDEMLGELINLKR